MKTKDENLFILYLHITLLYRINLDTMDLLLTQKSMSTSTKLLSFNEKNANHWDDSFAKSMHVSQEQF